MRKLLFFAAMVLLCACSQKEQKPKMPSFRERAVTQMKATIRRVVADPDPIISDTEVKFVSDSVAIIHCVIRAHNKLGGYAKQETEYIYGICQDGTLKEYMEDAEESSVIFSVGAGNMLKSLAGDGIPNFKSKQDSINYFKTEAMNKLNWSGQPIKNEPIGLTY